MIQGSCLVPRAGLVDLLSGVPGLNYGRQPWPCRCPLCKTEAIHFNIFAGYLLAATGRTRVFLTPDFQMHFYSEHYVIGVRQHQYCNDAFRGTMSLKIPYRKGKESPCFFFGRTLLVVLLAQTVQSSFNRIADEAPKMYLRLLRIEIITIQPDSAHPIPIGLSDITSMIALVIQALSASVCLYLLWRYFMVDPKLSNIPGPPRTSWWRGCFDQFNGPGGWKFHNDLIAKYGSVVKVPMNLGDDQVYVSDPLALHHIIVKDQYIYEETSNFIMSNRLVFGHGLLSTLGDHHRKQRKMLNPVFSLKHMRDLLPIFYPIAHDLRDVLSGLVKDDSQVVDLLDWASRAALDYIGQAGFGYSFNALHDEEGRKYGMNVGYVGPLLNKTFFYREFLPWLPRVGSPAFRRKFLDWVPIKSVQELTAVVDAMDNGSRVIYQEKKTAVQNGDEELNMKINTGKDILSVLMKANMAADEKDRLPEEEIIGQLNTFILAGQDTTSHAISRTLHLLTLNQDVQTRLREEIVSAKKDRGGVNFDYDTLMGLPYLDAVCRETLRVFPPVQMVARTTRNDVVMPLAWPIRGADGKSEIKEIPLKKDTNVLVSIVGANRSKKIWGDDAEEWKPERWLKPLPESVAKAHMPGVYSSMMTFIGGGRACIGFKFAEMELKLVLTVLLESFKFLPGPELDWKTAGFGINKPILKGHKDSTPQLPLKVTLLGVGA